MSQPIRRRTLLAGGAAAAAAAGGLSLPAGAAYAGGRPGAAVHFTLNAVTLDGGEQVVSITLDTSRLGPIDPRSLTTGTFGVHAKATSPIPIAADDMIFSEYDLDRTVTGVRIDRHGDIVVDLSYGEGQLGGGTLGYILSRQRNVRLDLVYTITQHEPIRVRGRGEVTIGEFRQGRLSNPEVDAFGYGISRSGLKYRLFSPEQEHGHRGRGGRPLVLWLHGGGEGASLPDNYYDNETTLRANRGALGFATPTAQRIFDGSYVVAPQSTSYWIEDGPRFAPMIKEIVDHLVRRLPIDTDRIYVAGCSNGGYMTMEMTSVYKDFFAAAMPICGVVQSLVPGGPRLLTDAQLAAIRTPSWLVASADDTTVEPQSNSVLAHSLIPGSELTLYDHVIWNGYQFPGHWSWIYVARNDPSIAGEHIWQWIARHRR
jgi:predicted esterase